MYNNLAVHAARYLNDEIRRSATRPERLMAHEAQFARSSRRRRRRNR
ncbi:MAG: hypothetical protein ACXWDI_00880 [Nocardioides sp.]